MFKMAVFLWFHGLVVNTTFNNILVTAVNFSGGGNRNTRRKPLICNKSLTNFIFIF